MPQPIKTQKPQKAVAEVKKEILPIAEKRKEGILSRFEKDDLILAAVLIILLMDGCDDWLLVAVIGGLFLFDK